MCVRVMQQTPVRRQACLRSGDPPQCFQRRIPLSQLRVQRGAIVPQQRARRLDVGRRALVYEVLCATSELAGSAHAQRPEFRLRFTGSG